MWRGALAVAVLAACGGSDVQRGDDTAVDAAETRVDEDGATEIEVDSVEVEDGASEIEVDSVEDDTVEVEDDALEVEDDALELDTTESDAQPDIEPDTTVADITTEVAPDPCDGVVCDSAPPPRCLDASRLEVASATGACDDGTCVYATETVICSLGCDDAACLGDPCAGVVCDQPPSACHASVGTCSGGVCSYAFADVACDDGDACTRDDACTSGTCGGSVVVCATPPEPRCVDAARLEVASPNGVCDAGACGYATELVTCPFGCEDDTCVGDPCVGVVCDTPPSACHQALGTCTDGVCGYAFANGASCDDADPCTTNDVCGSGLCAGATITCNTPPAATCVGESLRTAAATGTCAAGVCDYVTSDFACDFGCQAGACLGDPCAGVACDDPPSACHSPSGTCSGGVCTYAFANGLACDDADPCTTADTCDAGACAGADIVCDDPPAPTCVGNSLRTSAAAGTCAAGVCDYVTSDFACDFGCQAGACLGDPCAGVACDDPPSACHSPSGTCSGGVCTYAFANGITCDDADPCTTADTCDAGACAGADVVCDDPPAPTCVGNSLRTSAAAGTCAAGACEYVTSDAPCTFGCQAGACLADPCLGVVCDDPPSACHSPSGTCSGGVCAYAFANGITCDDADPCTTADTCDAGACAGADVVCDDPPAPTCVGNSLRTAAAAGTCASGACEYVTSDAPCTFGCQAGACLADPCLGVVCDDPPSACHSPSGTCSGGVCAYAFANGITCDDADPCTTADTCDAGACAGADVVCDDPPAPTCVGNSLRTAAATGSCSAGACEYVTFEAACTFGCDDGACLPPSGLVISELFYLGGADAFIELHGPGELALDGLTLVAFDAAGDELTTVALSGSTTSDGYFVVAQPEAQSWVADVADLFVALPDPWMAPASLQLRYGALVVDALAFGDFGAADVPRGEGDPEPEADGDASLTRDEAHSDTDDNASDFDSGEPTPGTTPVVAPPINCNDPALTLFTRSDSVSGGTPDTYVFNTYPGGTLCATTTNGTQVNVNNGTSSGIYCSGTSSCAVRAGPNDNALAVTVTSPFGNILSYTLTVRYLRRP